MGLRQPSSVKPGFFISPVPVEQTPATALLKRGARIQKCLHAWLRCVATDIPTRRAAGCTAMATVSLSGRLSRDPNWHRQATLKHFSQELSRRDIGQLLSRCDVGCEFLCFFRQSRPRKYGFTDHSLNFVPQPAT